MGERPKPEDRQARYSQAEYDELASALKRCEEEREEARRQRDESDARLVSAVGVDGLRLQEAESNQEGIEVIGGRGYEEKPYLYEDRSGADAASRIEELERERGRAEVAASMADQRSEKIERYARKQEDLWNAAKGQHERLTAELLAAESNLAELVEAVEEHRDKVIHTSADKRLYAAKDRLVEEK